MKNILVTGGAGFIGSNLVLELQKRYPKAAITVVDDFRGSSFKNLLGFNGDVLAFNVSDPAFLTAVKGKKFDTIFHMASITDTTVLDEKLMMYDNVEGFRNILNIAVRSKSDVVYASSAAVYGNGPAQPKSTGRGKKDQEEATVAFKESDAGHPNNIYGYSKWVMEKLAERYESKLKIVGLRFFNVFGPGETFKGKAASMIYQLYLQMKSGKRPRIFKYGEQRRDFIYVKDVVEAILLAADAKKNTSVNVGTGRPTSFNALIAALNEALGTSYEPEYFDNPYDFYQDFTQADMSHSQKATGFKCKFTTREAILDYVRNYLEVSAAPSKNAAPQPVSSR
jgi:ADP-L-glycero-D-manno-heptose 6-epimerase